MVKGKLARDGAQRKPMIAFNALSQSVSLVGNLLLYGEQHQASVVNLRILSWGIPPMFAGLSFGDVALSRVYLAETVPWVTGIGLGVVLVTGLVLIPRLRDKSAGCSVLITCTVAAVGHFLAVRGSLFLHSDKK